MPYCLTVLKNIRYIYIYKKNVKKPFSKQLPIKYNEKILSVSPIL